MAFLRCDKCQTLLPGAVVNTLVPMACPGCRTPTVVAVFPAFFRAVPVGRAAELLGSEEDAGCFYHPRKKAVVPCGECGRFLCALCDLEIDGRHLCPACVEGARTAGKSLHLSKHRTLHDQLALTLAVVGPFFFLFASLITAPFALFLAIRHWNEPTRSPVPRTRARVIAAALLAGAEIIAWLVYFYLRATGRSLLD